MPISFEGWCGQGFVGVTAPAEPASGYYQKHRTMFLVLLQVRIDDPFDDARAARLYRRMITPAQCRAARGLVKWNQKELAAKSGVSSLAINRFECNKSSPHNATLKVIRDTFEAAGVLFIDADAEAGAGVRLGE